MKKAVLIGLMFGILLTSSITVIKATDTNEEGVKSQKLTYKVEVGDEEIFNIFVNVSAGFENTSVYEEISNWANLTSLSEIVGELSDVAGFIENYTEQIHQDFQLKLNITQKYAEWENITYDNGTTRYNEWDIFNSSMHVREPGEELWLIPDELNMDKIIEAANFMINTLGITLFQDEIQNASDYVLESTDELNFDNTKIQRLHTVENCYHENGNLCDPIEPHQSPFEFYEFLKPVFFKPDEYHFDEWLTFLEDSINYQIEQAESENNIGSYESFDQMINYAGIMTLEANPNGFALVLNIAYVNESFIRDYISDVEINGITFDDLSELPLSDFEALVHFALEYDNDGILTDYVIYFDFSVVVDTMEDYAEGNGPYIDSEQFHVSIVAGVYGEDYSMASRDQIAAGEVGDDRNIGNNLFGALGEIPGYPIGTVSLLALISVASLMLKNKRK